MRRQAKAAAEGAAVVLGLTALARRLTRRSVSILAYHNVVDPADAGRGDSSLHLPLPRFVEQIDRLRETHDIVDLESALRTKESTSRPRAVITFDDAYRGAVTLALPELIRRGMPAVMFVAPGLLGASATWWDELAEGGALSAGTRRAAMEDLAGDAERVRSWGFRDEKPPRLPPSFAISTADELRQNVNVGGEISLGSHAWGHEHLPSLPDPLLRSSLRRSLEWIADFGAPRLPWLALPYGAGSDRVVAAARAVGYAGVLRIDGGRLRPGISTLSTPRINVPAGLSTAGLELRTSGLLRRR